MAMFS